ncbi:MAG: SPOR domain-containing protein [Sulfuritalea sp.]|jgi:DedD protein|nr:SPOR domain-containing protein [Sulfuritalea sp.]
MAEQDTSPDELQLKKRARRRLVGAVALALFAVIVLPMVMDREPRPLSQDIQVRIPSQDSTGFASKLLPGKPATPMPAPEPKPAAEEKPSAQAKAEPAPAPSTPPLAATKPTAPASVAPPAKPAERPAAQEKKIEPAENPAAKDAADAAGQWVVQLGAYKDAGKVRNLMSKLKGINVPAYTEKTETPQGPLTRVRAGPFPSQEAAEKARGRVKIIGVDGPVAPR